MSRIFLSHASEDNEQATQLCKWLEDQGWGPVFEFTRDMRPGEDWKAALARRSRQCVAVVCLVSRHWLVKPECVGEFNFARYGNEDAAFRARKAIVPIFLEDIPHAQWPSGMTDYQATTLDWDPQSLRRLAAHLREVGLSPDNFAYNPSGESDYSPFHGLATLVEDDAAIFFGRDAEIAQSLRALRGAAASNGQTQLVVWSGASGAGKSSLMRAGVLPRVARDVETFLALDPIQLEPRALTQPRRRDSTRVGLLESLNSALKAANLPTVAIEAFPAADRGAAALCNALGDLRGAMRQTGGRDVAIVLPIDQGEEALGASEGEKKLVLDMLDIALKRDPQLLIALTVRDDACIDLLSAAPFAGREFDLIKLEPLAQENLTDVLAGPARVCEPPLEIDPELPPALFADLTQDGSAKGDLLPLMALTLERLYDQGKGARRLTLEQYERIGRAAGVLRGVVRDASFKHNVTEDEMAEAIVPAFITLNASGQPVRRVVEETAIPESQRRAVAALEDVRLLRRSAGEGGAQIELRHESIARIWPAVRHEIDLRRGALDQLRRLRSSVETWKDEASAVESDRSARLVHRGGELAAVQRLRKDADYSNFFDADAQAYLTACRGRELRRFGIVGAATCAALMCFGVAVTASSVLRVRAWAEGVADQQVVPDANFAVAAGAPPGAALPSLSGAGPCAVGGEASAADCLLRRSGAVEPLHAVLRANETLLQRTMLGGNQLVTLDGNHHVVVWPLDRPSSPIAINDTHRPNTIAFAGDDTLTGGEDGTIGVWSGSAERRRLSAHGRAVTALLAVGANRLVSAGHDGTVRFWDYPALTPVAENTAHSLPVRALLADDAGTRVVSLGLDGKAVVFGADGQQQRVMYPNRDRPIVAGVIADGGAVLVSAARGAPVAVRGLADGANVATFEPHAAAVVALGAGTGDLVASGDDAGVIWIWHARTGEAVRELHHGGAIRSLTFSADGSLLLSASQDGSARLWNVETGAEITRFGGLGPLLYAGFWQSETRVVVVGERSAHIREPAELGRETGAALRARVCGNAYNRGLVRNFSAEQRVSWPGFLNLASNPCEWRGLFGG